MFTKQGDKNIGKKSNLSLIFLILVIIITILLYLYNVSLKNSNDLLLQKISERNNDIVEIKKNKNIEVYNILEKNKSLFTKMDKMNKITNYIDHITSIENKYNLEFSGFSFNNGKLDSNILVKSSDSNIAYKLTKDFISQYRKDKKALFNLDFINSFTGMDNIKFNVNFELK